MLRVMTVVGVRPQFIKAAVVSRALKNRATEILVHTGQHFDFEMSERFFEELSIPKPDYNLNVSGGPHGEMTARMMTALESVILTEKPDVVVVYGDTNSTLAAAIVASKLHIELAHVEAGLRSFNRKMPEEINRIVTDHVSQLLFCPTQNAVDLLAKEGLTTGVHFVGDVMYDSVRYHVDRTSSPAASRRVGDYALATVHRPENTDSIPRLRAIFSAMSALDIDVILPLHPRTREVLDANPELQEVIGENLKICEPMSYLEILGEMTKSKLVLTDSGGMQKESLFVGVPCVTLRDQTEWPETVSAGANVVVGADRERIIEASKRVLESPKSSPQSPSRPFGDGHAGTKIVDILTA